VGAVEADDARVGLVVLFDAFDAFVAFFVAIFDVKLHREFRERLQLSQACVESTT
jgi:hypothetical protein